MKKLKATLLLLLMCAGYTVQAQDTLRTNDTLAQSVSKLHSDIEALKKIKLSGYIQAQFQVADSSGIPSFEGGDFAPGVDKRFMVRRARLKVMYDNTLTQYVLQFDVSEKGLAIKDAYVKVTEPWLKTISLTAGMQNRPFGYEVPYSSSQRESPERGRMSQTLFPGERDLGAMITIQAPKTSSWNILKIEAGMFNGTGAPSAGKDASDFDFQKDFIGHIGINQVSKSEKIKYGIGASYYNGGYRQSNKYVYNLGMVKPDTLGFIVDSSDVNKGQIAKREYIGADAQLSFEFPFGITTLRGEYIQGGQPGTSSTTKSPQSDPAADTYKRKFNGGYFYFLQNIGQTKHQVVVKYDWYDPNTEVAGDEIGRSKTKLNKTDIKYSTLGLGWIYHWDHNVKFTTYYALVNNETSKNLAGYTKDIKDNVLTLRVQYKF